MLYWVFGITGACLLVFLLVIGWADWRDEHGRRH